MLLTPITTVIVDGLKEKLSMVTFTEDVVWAVAAGPMEGSPARRSAEAQTKEPRIQILRSTPANARHLRRIGSVSNKKLWDAPAKSAGGS